MTKRKPPETSWETWIDWQIRVATEEGAFDNLPGAGKPLPNYGPDDDPLAQWVKRQVEDEQIFCAAAIARTAAQNGVGDLADAMDAGVQAPLHKRSHGRTVALPSGQRHLRHRPSEVF